MGVGSRSPDRVPVPNMQGHCAHPGQKAVGVQLLFATNSRWYGSSRHTHEDLGVLLPIAITAVTEVLAEN